MISPLTTCYISFGGKVCGGEAAYGGEAACGGEAAYGFSTVSCLLPHITNCNVLSLMITYVIDNNRLCSGDILSRDNNC